MTDALTRAQEGADFGFAVRDDFVLITDTQERADDVAAAEETLADDADFAGDREALGGDQVALALGRSVGGAGRRGEPGGRAGGAGGRARRRAARRPGHPRRPRPGRRPRDGGHGLRRLGRRCAERRPDPAGAGPAGGHPGGAVRVRCRRQRRGGLGGAGASPEPWPRSGNRSPSSASSLPDDLRAVLGSDLVVAVFGERGEPGAGRAGGHRGARGGRPVCSTPSWARSDVGAAPVYSFGGERLRRGHRRGHRRRPGGRRRSRRHGRLPGGRRRPRRRERDRLPWTWPPCWTRWSPRAAGPARRPRSSRRSEALGLSVSGTDDGSRFVLRITTR